MHRRSFDGAGLFTGKRGIHVPNVPEPDKKEIPAQEPVPDLIHKPEHKDTRPIEYKPHQPIFEPRYNVLYGSLRTEGGWRYAIDNYANGTVLTVANATTVVAVKLTLALDHKRLSEWPNATQLFLCIRNFSLAPQAAPTTAGVIDVQYQDTIGGQLIPIGDMVSNSQMNIGLTTLIPTPITDPGILTVGNLLFFLNTGATVGTLNWQMAFSYAYMLPANEPNHATHTKGGPTHVRGSHVHSGINNL